MNRRDFTKNMLLTVTGVAFLETLIGQELLVNSVRPLADHWLKDLDTMCNDLKRNVLTPGEWQTAIAKFHSKLPLEDLIKTIDFNKAISSMKYPDLGVVVTDPVLPKVAGVGEQYSFIGRIFGMQKDRAIIPHGHKNMTSCHRVLKGGFQLKQYDRVSDDGDFMFIKQTIDETGLPGSFSSISDDKNNIHWLVANTQKAYTFDVIVYDLKELPTEIDNIDIDNAVKETNGVLKVKKIKVREALEKYGKSHH